MVEDAHSPEGGVMIRYWASSTCGSTGSWCVGYSPTYRTLLLRGLFGVVDLGTVHCGTLHYICAII